MPPFGRRFKAATRAQLRRKATPLSGAAPEAIWQQFYDTQSFVGGTTVSLQFFRVTSTDRTISNMEAAGQFPDPQWLTLYDVTLDFLSENTLVVGVTDVTGELNDLSRILKIARGTWTLTISDKRYGPYSLTLLHGTGGPVGNFFPGNTAATGNAQWANNTLAPGWNYSGSLIIPPKTNFNIELNFAATQVIVNDPLPLRISLHGILSRRVL